MLIFLKNAGKNEREKNEKITNLENKLKKKKKKKKNNKNKNSVDNLKNSDIVTSLVSTTISSSNLGENWSTESI